MWGTCCLTSFFPIVDTCLSCKDIAQQSCAMVHRWQIFGNFCVLYFQRLPCSTCDVSDLHLKFALRPHHVRKYGRHPICDSSEAMKKRRKKIETTGQKYNGLCYRVAIINDNGRCQWYKQLNKVVLSQSLQLVTVNRDTRQRFKRLNKTGLVAD